MAIKPWKIWSFWDGPTLLRPRTGAILVFRESRRLLSNSNVFDQAHAAHEQRIRRKSGWLKFDTGQTHLN
jgi:hypothetical protein